MSSWPFTYDYLNPYPPENPTIYRQMTIEKLWDLLVTHLELFITHHIHITTTNHFLYLSYYLLDGTLRNRGDLSYRDAATLSFIYKIGSFRGPNWAMAMPDWLETTFQQERCYQVVNHK
jgi:hypothetical protein